MSVLPQTFTYAPETCQHVATTAEKLCWVVHACWETEPSLCRNVSGKNKNCWTWNHHCWNVKHLFICSKCSETYTDQERSLSFPLMALNTLGFVSYNSGGGWISQLVCTTAQHTHKYGEEGTWMNMSALTHVKISYKCNDPVPKMEIWILRLTSVLILDLKSGFCIHTAVN